MVRLIALAVGLATAACGQAGSDAEAAPAAKVVRRGTMSAADYDRWRRPDLLIAALGLEPGQSVADIGAGRGYLTGRLAAAVGSSGRVVATDIDPDALARIAPAGPGMAPIEPRVVTAAAPGLEPAGYDVVLLAQVDQELVDPAAYLASLLPALKPGGRIAVSNRLQHRARLLAAVPRAGYHVVAEHDEIAGQFLVLLSPTTGAP